MSSTCRWKSNVISRPRPCPYGISDVVNPLADTYSGTCHQWFIIGSSASRTLPTTWVHMCSVSRVSCHAETGSSGHASLTTSTTVILTRDRPATRPFRRAGPGSGSRPAVDAGYAAGGPREGAWYDDGYHPGS